MKPRLSRRTKLFINLDKVNQNRFIDLRNDLEHLFLAVNSLKGRWSLYMFELKKLKERVVIENTRYQSAVGINTENTARAFVNKFYDSGQPESFSEKDPNLGEEELKGEPSLSELVAEELQLKLGEGENTELLETTLEEPEYPEKEVVVSNLQENLEEEEDPEEE